MNLELLKEEIPFQWRVQSFSKYKPEATCVAYIDARDAQELLDKVVGPENWQDEYYQVKNTMVCKVGIKIGGEWVWKSDGGAETDVEAEKGELSDSFKRACVKWGIGRFLYAKSLMRVKANEAKTDKNRPYVVDDNGKQVWDITAYINKGYKKPKTNLNSLINMINKTKNLEELSSLKNVADETKKTLSPIELEALKKAIADKKSSFIPQANG